MEFLRQNWEWIAMNPWGFGTFIILAFGAGWTAAKLFYRERLELLKARAESTNHVTNSESAAQVFEYVANGRHGPNILAATLHDIVVDQELSLRANIPEGQTLHVVLHGSPDEYLDDTSAAWAYNVVGVTNWVMSKYQDSTSPPVQHFNAESGRAELELSFCRPGIVRVEVFEGSGTTPTWVKELCVHAMD